MGVRVGVDVGGTFTKAVALDRDARVVARAVVPTTHSHPDGVAAGVIEVVRLIAAELAGAGQGPEAIELVTHSTTQAVNALLEGDVVPVGILGMATAPHVGKARKRTRDSECQKDQLVGVESSETRGAGRSADHADLKALDELHASECRGSPGDTRLGQCSGMTPDYAGGVSSVSSGACT